MGAGSLIFKADFSTVYGHTLTSTFSPGDAIHGSTYPMISGTLVGRSLVSAIDFAWGCSLLPKVVSMLSLRHVFAAREKMNEK